MRFYALWTLVPTQVSRQSILVNIRYIFDYLTHYFVLAYDCEVLIWPFPEPYKTIHSLDDRKLSSPYRAVRRPRTLVQYCSICRRTFDNSGSL